jgi:hypothetical protein
LYGIASPDCMELLGRVRFSDDGTILQKNYSVTGTSTSLHDFIHFYLHGKKTEFLISMTETAISSAAPGVEFSMLRDSHAVKFTARNGADLWIDPCRIISCHRAMIQVYWLRRILKCSRSRFTESSTQLTRVFSSKAVQISPGNI